MKKFSAIPTLLLMAYYAADSLGISGATGGPLFKKGEKVPDNHPSVQHWLTQGLLTEKKEEEGKDDGKKHYRTPSVAPHIPIKMDVSTYDQSNDSKLDKKRRDEAETILSSDQTDPKKMEEKRKLEQEASVHALKFSDAKKEEPKATAPAFVGNAVPTVEVKDEKGNTLEDMPQNTSGAEVEGAPALEAKGKKNRAEGNKELDEAEKDADESEDETDEDAENEAEGEDDDASDDEDGEDDDSDDTEDEDAEKDATAEKPAATTKKKSRRAARRK